MTASAFRERVQRNRTTMRGPALRRGLLALIPLYYVITVGAREFEGVALPGARWDLGPHAWSLVNTSCFIFLLAAAHWIWTRRT